MTQEGRPFLLRSEKCGLIVSNPGTRCAREYAELPQKPVIVLYERGTGLDKYEPPNWTSDFSADRFSVLLYDVKSKDEMEKAYRDAAAGRIGYFYVTDAEGRNPWNRLPRYWKDEVTAAKAADPKTKGPPAK